MAIAVPIHLSFLQVLQTLAQATPEPEQAGYWPWIIAGGILFLGLVAYGGSDLIRTHWRRVWAISGVCVTESRRRRVLWLTPLAMLGIIVVCQFQVSADPQQSIQQTTKFCLFASALLVTVTAIILACTNLPREIENRVIYTIVTKPTTRLEIVLGKVLGYARVAGMIILIMGIFTLGYLQFRLRPMIADLKAQVATLPPNSPVRATTEYYINSGLLGTRSLEWGSDVQIYAEPPTAAERWSLGGVGQYVLLPFNVTANEAQLLREAAERDVPVYINFNLDIRQHPPDERERQEARDMKLEEGQKTKSPDFNIPLPGQPATQPAEPVKPPSLISAMQVRFLDGGQVPLIKMDQYNAGDEVVLKPLKPGEEACAGALRMSPEVLKRAAEVGRFFAQVSPRTPATEFGFRDRPAVITLPIPGLPPIQMAVNPARPSEGLAPIFAAYPVREGIRLTPVRPWAAGPVAVFHFHDVKVTPGNNGKVGLQVGVAVERSGDVREDAEHPIAYTEATLEVVNRKTGQSSGPIKFAPETSRSEPVGVDAKYMDGGDFEVLLRDTTTGQNLGIETGQNGAIALVSADRNFVLNLVKSLFILWLLSLLVVIIAIFCSTFVSWPIAVVLTLVILLSHWGVDQLGSSLDKGTAGRSAVTGFGIRDPASSEVVATTVDRLSTGLKYLSYILPDVSEFPVMEDIERGVSIPPAKVFGAIRVILCYGFPMLVFSYVILRRKEVAP